jgi:hypothetical protein
MWLLEMTEISGFKESPIRYIRMPAACDFMNCVMCGKSVRYDDYADHLRSQHACESLRSMRNTVEFNDRPAKRHKAKDAEGPTTEADHLGPQSRDARINTTSFIWWNLIHPTTKANTTLTCCLRCRRIPFHFTDSSVVMKNGFYRWILGHAKKGCFDSIDEYRKATKTTIQDITAGRISNTITTDVRKTDIRLGLKKKRTPKVAVAKPEISVSEAINTVSETTTPVSETASGNTLSKEAHDILLEINGPFGEGDTIPPTDELVETARDLLRAREATIKRLQDTSELSRTNATLRMRVTALEKQVEDQKFYIEDQDAQMKALRNEMEHM